MHLRAKFTVFLSFLLVSLHAQELSLDEAVDLALEYNLNLRKNRIDLAASGYSEKRLWSEIFPTISASARAGFGLPLFSDEERAVSGGLENINFGISLGFNAGIPYAMKNIKLAHQANLLNYDDARTQLSILVTKRYYSLVAEKNNLLLLEEVFNLAQRTYDRNQVSFRNGIVSELSLTQSSLALENARYNLSAASIAYANSMAEFLSLLGIAENSIVTLADEINIVRISTNAEALISEYLSKRPDIARITQEIERLEFTKKQLNLRNRAPSLNLSFGWSVNNFDPFADRLSGTATLNIPIDPWIPGTSTSQSINRASNSVEKAKLDLESAENSAKTQIRSLSALLRNSYDSILIARLSLEAAQRSYQLTELGFNNGTVEALALEDARNNMASARQRLFQSELAYFNMILDLSAAINIDWKNLIQTYGVQDD